MAVSVSGGGLRNRWSRSSLFRSGEGRVGEEWRTRWVPDHLKKKKKIEVQEGSQLVNQGVAVFLDPLAIFTHTVMSIFYLVIRPRYVLACPLSCHVFCGRASRPF